MFDFPTKVDDLAVVPAEYQSLYEQADDGEGFRMIPTLAKKVEDMGNLQETLGKLRKQVAESQKALKGFTAIAKTPEELDQLIGGYRAIAETPEALAELLAEKDKLLEGKDTTKAIEQIKAAHQNEVKKLTEKFSAEIAERENKLAKLSKSLETEMLESALVAEISKQKGISDLILPVAMRFVRVVEDANGNYVRQVVDKDGDPRVNIKGEPMTIAELIAEMRQSETFARAFDGDDRRGSGSNPNGGTPNPKAKVYTLQEWQKAVGTASADERRKLLAEKAAGKIIVRN